MVRQQRAGGGVVLYLRVNDWYIVMRNDFS